MPSLRSFGPTVKPSSSLCTMNAEIPLAPLSGSLTAITVYQLDLPPLVIQHLVPLRIQSSPSATWRGSASPPRRSRPRARSARRRPSRCRRRSTAAPASSAPRSRAGSGPWCPACCTAGISEADASTRATSSMTMHAATESAPCPPYSSGTCTALKPDAFSASSASCGNREFSSTSAAYGAISFSASARIAARSSSVFLGQLEQIERGISGPASHLRAS